MTNVDKIEAIIHSKRNKIERLFALLVLFIMIVFFVIPFFGYSKNTRTNIVGQKKSLINIEKEITYKKRNKVKETETHATVTSNENWFTGYVTDNVNIRKKPNSSSEIYDICKFNTCITYTQYSNEWVKIKYNKNIAYISNRYISNSPCSYMEYNMPINNGFKSYMSFDSITNKSSLQYKIQNKYAYTGKYGIRQVSDRYCIAIGTAFNVQIGDYADLVLENDQIIPVIISDIKSDKDTDCNNIATVHNGCVSEFIVDEYLLKEEIVKCGDVSVAKAEWNSNVAKIKIYNKNIFNEGE